eukprot:CAMPEP_0204902732 /NCGR_PEP_ID=MMETSP1397-20131031/3845_1 /ASSEMBLY_ACC=CAM_ASM_000891 /TAXON_ID=49980 /ORGANISM="Climacostomum Climacostomum virens, Strain Stock W-24" /LENGTH=64 /DNA_ID=CAMNT_0052071281 /DNA_START=173 /DNA_END=367 /DNA_ORIENTATION=+
MATYRYTGILTDAGTVQESLQSFVDSYSLPAEVTAELDALGSELSGLEEAISELEGVVTQLEQV